MAARPSSQSCPYRERSPRRFKHIIIVVQENRSFANLLYGFPGADTATVGTLHDGSQVVLAPVPLDDGHDIGHFHFSFKTAFDAGKMDGFDLEQGSE